MRAAVLDLGSNSFHCLVADIAHGRLHPIAREREMLHLGRVLEEHGELPPEVRARVVDTVAHLGELARRTGATERVAVATAALRELPQGEALLEELSRAAGTVVRVLPGEEEARLSYLGACSAVPIDEGATLVLDLGGGSLELAVGTRGDVDTALSLPLGGSRLMSLLANDPPTPAEVDELLARVDRHLEPHVATLAGRRMPMVAVGGAVRALARVCRAGAWLPPTVNMVQLRVEELEVVRDRLLALDHGGRLGVEGMTSRRADHLHVAAVILVRVLRSLGIERVTVSDWGLREGVLLEAHGASVPPHGCELREREIGRLRRALLPDAPAMPHVVTLCERVFDGTHVLHGLGVDDRELLRHAARLMDVGRTLALRRHQQHGAYLVEHGELKGFRPTEIAIIATLVRFHPSRGLDERFPPFASLGTADASRARRLLPLLQLADALDRPRDEAVTDVAIQLRNGHVAIALLGRDRQVARAELARRASLFISTFGVEVELVDRMT
jgi:exopolyphosphatase / guanosine-5'-triphosphate,3'-diphosphate pyrophosphatase